MFSTPPTERMFSTFQPENAGVYQKVDKIRKPTIGNKFEVFDLGLHYFCQQLFLLKGLNYIRLLPSIETQLVTDYNHWDYASHCDQSIGTACISVCLSLSRYVTT